MNINDVEDTKEIPENIWEEIFAKQWELALKYKDIEQMGDLLDTLDNNINTAKGQKWIKDFAWRVTEELSEAYEVYGAHEEHFKEELIDALHFLVELTIIAGYKNYTPKFTGSIIEPWDTIFFMGLMCNTLKNKPWKQTQMLTDRVKFYDLLNKTWQSFYGLLRYNFGNDDEIYQYYFKKHSVNKFRQRSKY